MPPPPATADYPLERPMQHHASPVAKVMPRQVESRARVVSRRSLPGKDFLQRLREAGL
ncbi:hypothetical protein [Aquabacterium humicola]|uniref:hypothetical protein n=1 Tax=Aquabacterium humicola TaxID=3237377 RepID=UPI002542E455|nr:hypothetical protein [Rubrivivax pictus]